MVGAGEKDLLVASLGDPVLSSVHSSAGEGCLCLCVCVCVCVNLRKLLYAW